MDYIYFPQPKDQKNDQFVQKYEYRHSVQDYNNIAPSHKTHSTNRLQEHEKSGIYKITCKTYHKAYVGQKSRNLKSRFREHTRYIKNIDPSSAYALHILNCRHEYGNIDDTMTLLKQINTPTFLLPYEQMYTQSFHHNNELIPEQHLNEHNPMFDLLHSNTTHHNPPDA